jgi:hypothetical protein
MLLLPAAMAIMLGSRLGPVLGGGIQFPPRPFGANYEITGERVHLSFVRVGDDLPEASFRPLGRT